MKKISLLGEEPFVFDPQSWRLRQGYLPLIKRNAGSQVFFQQQRAIHIYKIKPSQEVGYRSATKRAFVHTTHHHLHAPSPGGLDHPARRCDSTAFGELDIDAMKMAFALFN